MGIILKVLLSVLLISGNIFPENKTVHKPQKYKIKKVVIDAGHGGKDPGAIGKKGKEKDITLAIALKLGTYIKKYIKGVEVIYTRKTDVFIELFRRSEIANQAGADLFISIHVNASKKRKIKGTSTFIMGLNKSQENLDVAKRENSVILTEKNYKSKYEGYDPNSPESEIMLSLFQNAYLEQSISLASKVQMQLTKKASREGRGVRQAGLVVLWNCTMPSILVETGFITNRAEEKYLMSDYGQSLIASAIFRAFRSYKEEVESKSNFSVKRNKKIIINKTNDSTSKKNDANQTLKKHKKEKSNVIFKVQIASSVKKIDTNPRNFRGIKNVKRQQYKTSKGYRYTVGNTSSFKEIVKLQKKIRKKLKGAYIIAFKNGKKISVKEALAEIKK